MKCPKCKTGIMVGDVDMGRSDGSGGCNQLVTRVWRCLLCSQRLYQDVAPVMMLEREQVKPNAGKIYNGGRPAGQHRSPAVDLAAKYFDWIRNELANGIRWTTISKLIKKATKAKFCEKSLERYWIIERDRRATQQDAARKAGQASAARKRAEVAA